MPARSETQPTVCCGGVDLIEARKARKAEQAVEKAKTLTFKECAEKYIAAHKAELEKSESTRGSGKRP